MIIIILTWFSRCIVLITMVWGVDDHDSYHMILKVDDSNHDVLRSEWTRSWRRRVSAKRSWRSSRWLRSRCPPSPPSCSWQSWVMTRNDFVDCQAQRVGDIPRLQGLSQQLELCNAKQQDLLRERDDHQRLLRFAFITSLLGRKKKLHVLFFGTCSIFIVLWPLFFWKRGNTFILLPLIK